MLRPARSFSAMLGHRLAVSAIVTAVLGLSALLPQVVTADMVPPEPSPAETLAGIHGCWSGPAPEDMRGKIPGHVVMILPDGSTVYSTDVARAMRHVFEIPERGLTVFAFCR